MGWGICLGLILVTPWRRKAEDAAECGHRQRYAWGSPTVLPQFLRTVADGEPWAELWFGAHPLAPATVAPSDLALNEAVSADPEGMLGDSVARAFDGALPYLMKLIAPAEPLSLQVHPTREHARECFAAENAAGLPLDSPERNYRDANHKPEMVLALEPFEALCGFRTPRKAASILEGLEAPLAKRMLDLLVAQPSAHGMRAAFRMLVAPAMRPEPSEITVLANECAARLESHRSPSPALTGPWRCSTRNTPAIPALPQRSCSTPCRSNRAKRCLFPQALCIRI